jgi:hypothetical protein
LPELVRVHGVKETTMSKISLGFAVLAFSLAGHAMAETVPAVKGEKAVLKLTVLEYKGGTNGAMSVEVSNPSSAPADFNSQGLYFVPEENANNAPQRLGAVGHPAISVPAGKSVKLQLDVYCIDSHRRSPKSGDKFHLAGTRMPQSLSNDIAKETRKAADQHGGYAAPAAKSSIQSEVWKQRDKKWLKLEGEGYQEATK